MKFGKTIKIFLIDGDPNGRMTCELSNWTGKAYKIPRNKIKDCKDRPDIFNTGIYLLFGKNQDNKDSVYIGEAETVLNRLTQHLGQKDFWNEAIVFVSKDENLNKAHVKYLENRLHDIAINVKRYYVENSNTPTLSSISESDRAEMEEYIENIFPNPNPDSIDNFLFINSFKEIENKIDNQDKDQDDSEDDNDSYREEDKLIKNEKIEVKLILFNLPYNITENQVQYSITL